MGTKPRATVIGNAAGGERLAPGMGIAWAALRIPRGAGAGCISRACPLHRALAPHFDDGSGALSAL